METIERRHVVLVGGGHAHQLLLRALAMRPEPGVRLTLVSPHTRAIYSGMVPGYLAGQYDLRDIQIDLQALAARAGAAFLADRVVRIDAAARCLELERRPPLHYDILCLALGSQPAGGERLAAGVAGARVKPIERAASEIAAGLAQAPPPGGRRIVVVGAGAGGCEIAFALAARVRREGAGGVVLCEREPRPLPGGSERAVAALESALAERAVEFVGGASVARVDAGGVHLADGRVLPATFVVWATGAAGPGLLARSDLPLDERGFLRVGDDLRCAEFPDILASGDCATLASHPHLPKAGVYAVRQAPVLEANLRALARGGRTRRFRPQRRFLSLLNTGDGRAILTRGGVALRSRAAWRLKDWIDRGYLRKFERPPLATRASMATPMIACGGCAAKIGADVLGRVLARLAVAPAEDVVVGLQQPDDAAVFRHPEGALAVATTDAFPPFCDDLYLVGRVAATNAASDLWAMGAEARAALAFVCLPNGDPVRAEEHLEHFLRGALAQLESMGIALVGGHTIVGEQVIVGFSMHGWVAPDAILRKAGAQVGDALVLSKPLGTGVVLAAARAGFADADWVEAAHAAMLRPNAATMRLLRRHGVRACTDVTGFGLGGHLDEMLRAAGVGARLERQALPALPGALELLAAGWRSSFHPGVGGGDPVRELCLDPQTSGGLLAAVPAAQLDALRAACAEAGEDCFVIGEVVAGTGWSLG